MKHLSVYDHMIGKRLAFLQNAFNIGYSIELNALWTARFSFITAGGWCSASRMAQRLMGK